MSQQAENHKVSKIDKEFTRRSIELSKRLGVKVLDHIKDDAFDVGSWWKDIASKMSTDELHRNVERMGRHELADIQIKLKQMLIDELESRSNQVNKIGGFQCSQQSCILSKN